MFVAAWIVLTLLADPHPSSVEFRAIRPDVQLERLLNLFEGTGLASPAEALAAWRQAAVETGPKPPGKGAQALIALLNPRMVRELRTLDGLTLWIDPGGAWRWSLVVPHDDGTLSSLATALALTDGASGEPVEGLPADRLDGPGSPWMARQGPTIIVSGDRDGLVHGWNLWKAVPEIQTDEPGYHARIDFQALSDSDDPDGARWGKTMLALGLQVVNLRAGIEKGSLLVAIRTRVDDSVKAPAGQVDPDWLDYLPTQSSAAVSWAVSPSGATLDRGFSALDRYLQPPGNAAPPAPSRARFNLTANLAGVRPEVELWPHLQGMTGFAIASANGQIERAALILHFDHEDAALAISDRVVPRLLKALNQTAEVRADGRSVLIGLGAGAVDLALQARSDPDQSAGDLLRTTWAGTPVSRCGAAWLGRWPGLVEEPTLKAALRSAPPIVWWGRRDGRNELDRVQWPDLRSTVARWVEAVPGTRKQGE